MAKRFGSCRAGFKLAETIAVVAILAILVMLLLPEVRRGVGPSARQSMCKNNLKQIALALYNYQEKYKALPPAYTRDANGRPLHSWRTLILPFLDEEKLYQEIDLTQPWDARANAAARKKYVTSYRCPSITVSDFYTTYLGVAGSNYVFHPTERRRLTDIKDGTSNTIMVIEVDSNEAVHWMDPQDTDGESLVNLDRTQKHPHGPFVVFIDGTVRSIESSVTAAERRSLLTIDGDEPIVDGKFRY